METIVYNAVAFGECVDRSPHGSYICFIVCNVMKFSFLLGIPHEVLDTVALFLILYTFLLLPKFFSE